MSKWRYMFLYSGGIFFEMASVIVIIVVVGVILNYFVFSITPIKGESMEPNFHTGDFAFVDKYSYLRHSPERGDVVGLRFPGDPNQEKYIKRVIGLPGDIISIESGTIYVNSDAIKESYLPKDTVTKPNLTIKLKDDQYYLVGDNRDNSSDSRIWGPASRKQFIGKVRMVVLPLKDFKFIVRPTY